MFKLYAIHDSGFEQIGYAINTSDYTRIMRNLADHDYEMIETPDYEMTSNGRVTGITIRARKLGN